ncbi:hypothetical protein [Nitratireductor sp. OM-1]|uniref:hypothetical protein n=1 Tax=Nitratireductor sp. OM-1 TaxID=1756988 RepID=UPI0013AF1689|nr:hypothetical protein [Nitratireductor sp. OM-1]
MQENQIPEKFPLMPGSSSGMTYLLLGRRGNMVIGIKPTVVMRGEAFGSPGNTWFGSKLRVAPGGDLIEQDDGPVVSLANAQKFSRPSEALPDVSWDNNGSQRASTTIGVMLEGAPDGTDEELKEFLKNLEDGSLSAKMTAYVVNLVGEENLKTSKELITEWFDYHYGEIKQALLKQNEKRKALKEAIKETVGVVGVQADVLKKVYAKVEKVHENADPSTDIVEDEYHPPA